MEEKNYVYIELLGLYPSEVYSRHYTINSKFSLSPQRLQDIIKESCSCQRCHRKQCMATIYELTVEIKENNISSLINIFTTSYFFYLPTQTELKKNLSLPPDLIDAAMTSGGSTHGIIADRICIRCFIWVSPLSKTI